MFKNLDKCQQFVEKNQHIRKIVESQKKSQKNFCRRENENFLDFAQSWHGKCYR